MRELVENLAVMVDLIELHWLSPFNVPHGTSLLCTLLGNAQARIDKLFAFIVKVVQGVVCQLRGEMTCKTV